jgi:hypothetical protein
MAVQTIAGGVSAAVAAIDEGPDQEERDRIRVRRLSRLGQWAVGFAIVILWEVLTRLKVVDPYYFSSPLLIAQTTVKAWTAGTLPADIAYTSAATVIGFVAGVAGGAVLGLSTWWSRVYGNVLEPYLVMFNAVPKLALAPVLIILFGIGFSSKIALATAMCLVPTAMAAYSGVRSVDGDMETLLFSLGAKDVMSSPRWWFRGPCRGSFRACGSTSVWRWQERSSGSSSLPRMGSGGWCSTPVR